MDNIEEQIRSCGYIPIAKKGSGAYGVVYEVEDKTGQSYALKFLMPEKEYEDFGIMNLLEVDVVSRIRHPNIIPSYTILTKNYCVIDSIGLLEPLGEGTLEDTMINPIDEKLEILFKITDALEFLHENGILHLDIKLSNVIITHDRDPYLIDFGLSLYTYNKKYHSSALVTYEYRPPEIFQGNYEYSSATDIYSLGILFLYLLSGKHIFSFIGEKDMLYAINQLLNPNKIRQYLQNVPIKYREYAIGLITRMVTIDPKERPTTREILANPLFSDIERQNNITDKYMIQPSISYDYDINHRDIIKFIIHRCPKTVSAEVLFLAIDLFNRVDSFYKGRSPARRLSVAITCLIMAGKMLDTYFRVQDFGVPKETIIQNEIDIIGFLQGILYPPYLYKICENGDQLQMSLQNVILSNDPSLYAKVDLPLWLRTMREALPQIKFPNKDSMLVSDLF